MRLILLGPPGAGKTLLARALPAILPKMSIDEALDVTRIYSVADQLPPDVPLIRSRDQAIAAGRSMPWRIAWTA